MKTRKTPQQKKAASYAHDRRNAYGESNKGSRKSVPRNKAISRRKIRRKFKNVRDDECGDVELKLAMRKAWRKWPDKPLAEYLEFQRGKRARLVGRKDRVRAEYAERLRQQAEEKLAEEKARAKVARKHYEIRRAKEKVNESYNKKA